MSQEKMDMLCDMDRVQQTIERFWQATAYNQHVEFRKLPAALQYVHASVYGAILDTLRAYLRRGEVSLPESKAPGEPSMEDQTCSSELWGILERILPDSREQQFAYLLFHCGLKPREIMHFCPQEWSSMQEIYCLRRTIMERVLDHVDILRVRLS